MSPDVFADYTADFLGDMVCAWDVQNVIIIASDLHQLCSSCPVSIVAFNCCRP